MSKQNFPLGRRRESGRVFTLKPTIQYLGAVATTQREHFTLVTNR